MTSELKTNNSISIEGNNLVDLYNYMKSILALDHYVAKSEYTIKLSGYKDVVGFFQVLNKSGMLKQYCIENGLNYQLCEETIVQYNSFDTLVDSKNDQFVEEQLILQKDYLDNILIDCGSNIILDEDQRKVVLTDEDYTLVIAGAGAGKTTTVAAKVKYLVDKKSIDPKKILVISYTNKAVNELKQHIIGELHIECPIATFHSTGHAVLRKNSTDPLNIVEPSKLYFIILDYLKNSIFKNESLVDSLILFFASYFDVPYVGADLKGFFNNIAKSNFTTMRSELEEYQRTIIDSRTKKAVTIQSETLRSRQEVEIANFLYLNNIDYEYEPLYPYYIPNARKAYTPDFIIHQGNNTAYIEHFGISEDGHNSMYTLSQLNAYKKAVNDKVKFHRKHGTKLLYTFSSYNDGRPITEHLQEILVNNDFILAPRSNNEILSKLVSSEENKYIRKLVTLIQRFIINFKVNGYSQEDFNRMYHSTQNVRTRLFLDVCSDCFLEYERILKESNAVDFEDMINESARVLREVEDMNQKLDFDYIIVDEYQDISRQRFDLVSALHKVTNAKIIAVGDDWQSIYAFSGSDISLFTKFSEKMGYAKLQKIVRTYRNSQEVIDIAGSFIQKNKEQIQKDLVSPKSITDPVIIYTYDATRKESNGNNRSGVSYAIAHAIEVAIEQIISYNMAEKKSRNSSILLLGRYGFEGDQLERSGLFEYQTRGSKLKSVKYPWLNITFMTAHASKGLGYDNVIIINGRNETYGFPSKIEDDPVLSFVVKGDKAIDYAEERRLFYVAMTRTKNRVFFIAPEQNPSEFLLEIKRDYKNVTLRGDWNDNPEAIPNYKKACPICGYPMQFRYKESLGLRLYLCTNEPEICGFMTNDYKSGKLGIMKCDTCRDGYLIVKKSNQDYFLGCTNYRSDETGCTRQLSRKKYYEMMRITDENPAIPIIFPSGLNTNPRYNDKYIELNNCEKAAEAGRGYLKFNSPDVHGHNQISNGEGANVVPRQYPILPVIKFGKFYLAEIVVTILQGLMNISKDSYYGRNVLISFLLGEADNRIIKNGLDNLPEYGTLHGMWHTDLSLIINWLIENRFILKTKSQYTLLHPTYKCYHYYEEFTAQNLENLYEQLKISDLPQGKITINDTQIISSHSLYSGKIKEARPLSNKLNLDENTFEYSSTEPLTISEITKRINVAYESNVKLKIKYNDLTSWLIHKGLFGTNPNPNEGYPRLIPTDVGVKNGFIIINRLYSNRNYHVVVCDFNAQKYIISNLNDILIYNKLSKKKKK